jgi:uncharacterized protein YpiB (UPF0302 family)
MTEQLTEAQRGKIYEAIQVAKGFQPHIDEINRTLDRIEEETFGQTVQTLQSLDLPVAEEQDRIADELNRDYQ